jgi:glycosyltransferase involved in cell wall biosynthesis
MVPLLYLFDGTTRSLTPWVRPVLYGPLLAAGILALVRRRRATAVALPALPARPSVAAVVPALDEAQALPALLAELPRELLDEVVVVDGGSRDGTPEVARARGARVVVERRRGYGRACATGAASTSADVVVFLDGDGSDDPAFVPAVLEPVLAGRAALALGARRSAERGALLLHQRAGNAVVAALVRVLYGVRLHDVPPLRAVRRDVLERLALSEMTYGWPTEMIVKAARDGLPLVEVPVRSRLRRGGASKIAGRLWPSACAGARMLAVVARHA